MTLPEHVDRIARHAAKLLFSGRATTVREAISFAGGSGRISRSLIVKHLAAMEESLLGVAAVNVRRAANLEVALEFMEILDSYFDRFTELYPDARGTRLAGRAAEGNLDGDPVVNLRVLAEITPAALVNLIMETGCDEPMFDVLNSRHGKLDRIRTRLSGVDVVLVICPPARVPVDENNLVRGTPVNVIDHVEVVALRESLLGAD